MKKTITYLMLAIPIIFIIYYWNELPDNIPMHWNSAGEVDRYSETKWGITVIPLINLGVYLLFLIIPAIDPKKNFNLFMSTYHSLITILIFFLFLIFLYVLYYSLGYEMNGVMSVNNIVALLILMMGNYLGKIRPNYFLGVRTPWTLENEDVWKATHRLTGKLWVGAGFAMLISSYFVPPALSKYLFVIFIIVIAGIPIAYSYLVYRKITDPNKS